ncbi:MAG: hypothetical protein CML17_03070 [Pusillimonas sp.]|nr:hypothetical protein [Pusillimonas sp.]
MAIDKGIAINHSDLLSTGGIKQILLRSWQDDDDVTFNNDAGRHDITSIVDTGNSTADWFAYEFKNEEASLTVNATKENGSTLFECNLSFMLPKLGKAKFHELQNLLQECMMAIVIDSNGTQLVIGCSEKYLNTASEFRSQTFLNLVSMEGGTGTAFTDMNGLTINMTARQFELPREYTGTLNFYTDATPSATLKATSS